MGALTGQVSPQIKRNRFVWSGRDDLFLPKVVWCGISHCALF
jgi:hypothetical protein